MVPRFGREILIGSILAPWVLGSVIVRASSAENAGDVRIDYVAKLNAQVEKGPEESLNVEPFYQMGFDLYVEAPIPLSGNDFKCWPTDLPPEKQSVLKEWAKSNALALAQLQTGTQKPHYWFQYQGNSVWEIGQTDHPSKTRELFWALIFQAKSRAAEGDVKGAIRDVLTSYRFALDMKKRLLLHEQLVGIAFLAYGSETAYQILEKTDVDGASLELMQDRIVALSQDRDCLIDLKPEVFVALDSIQSTFAGWRGERHHEMDVETATKVASQLSESFRLEMTAEQVHGLLHSHTPAELRDLARKGYSYYDSIVRKTPFQWRQEQIEFDTEIKELIGGNLLLLILAPAVEQAATLSARCRASTDALVATLASLRHHKETDRFPADLSELVSEGYLNELPMDPYSDKPLVYKRTEGNFTLYTLGSDFDDDGGEHSKWGQGEAGGDYVFWPIQMKLTPRN